MLVDYIKRRFTFDQVIVHEKELYKDSEKTTLEDYNQ